MDVDVEIDRTTFGILYQFEFNLCARRSLGESTVSLSFKNKNDLKPINGLFVCGRCVTVLRFFLSFSYSVWC